MQPSIRFQHISFHLPNHAALLRDLTFAFSSIKAGLIGDNGIGKSTLFKLIVGELTPASGVIQQEGSIFYVSQNPCFSENTTVAEFLGLAEKLHAYHKILSGSLDEQNFAKLNEDWEVQNRFQQQLDFFDLSYLPSDRKLSQLSGGELTKLMLTKAFFSDAQFLLLDEPSNHLDQGAKQKLLEAISRWSGGLLLISHDRALLNALDEIIELTPLGLTRHGGNYDFYLAQKTLELQAKENQLQEAKKQQQKTQHSIQSSYETHQHKKARGVRQRKEGKIDRLSANSKQGRSERTQSKLLIKNERMTQQAETQLQQAKAQMIVSEKIHIHLPKTFVPQGKMLLDIQSLDFSYADHLLIKNFNFILQGPKRIAIQGKNGAGKTTLIKLILNQLQPTQGSIFLGTERISYLDQETSLLDFNTSVLENFRRLNPKATEQIAHHALAQFLFRNTAALKRVDSLSGGERLRALLACVLLADEPPQLLILDEPTNHLDIKSIEQIESALSCYEGALIVISHDQEFLKNIHIEEQIFFEKFFDATGSS